MQSGYIGVLSRFEWSGWDRFRNLLDILYDFGRLCGEKWCLPWWRLWGPVVGPPVVAGDGPKY